MLREAIQHDRGPRKKKAKADFSSRPESLTSNAQVSENVVDDLVTNGGNQTVTCANSVTNDFNVTELIAQLSQRAPFALQSSFIQDANAADTWLKQFTAMYAYYRNALWQDKL